MNSQQRIRLARRHAGLSQSALAETVGVQRSAVSHWEAVQGKSPSMSNLRRVATVTGVQFEWLATGRGRMALSHEDTMDGVAAVDATMVDEPLELRMLNAFRSLPPRSQAPLVELMEQMAALRTGRSRSARREV
ncbi:helix-turn-helix domain-containing protein [Lysobacter claricitrinus]|uniref:helix-turn-helix domain-containing protein n=1 Tax=Lysobacter claricitrinus TaxID=3367728 RepID=UPI0037DAC7E5